ncbi:hypothetical protein DID78_04025 [Candidatus Marinamargulisbacteria bacterium SCGC AG-343-D04]|nr:hypothetical protein DID78_04025 [Candidatus Marinamargulisbacteria bacterium SCGC AG-343-D04]
MNISSTVLARTTTASDQKDELKSFVVLLTIIFLCLALLGGVSLCALIKKFNDFFEIEDGERGFGERWRGARHAERNLIELREQGEIVYVQGESESSDSEGDVLEIADGERWLRGRERRALHERHLRDLRAVRGTIYGESCSERGDDELDHLSRLSCSSYGSSVVLDVPLITECTKNESFIESDWI